MRLLLVVMAAVAVVMRLVVLPAAVKVLHDASGNIGLFADGDFEEQIAAQVLAPFLSYSLERNYVGLLGLTRNLPEGFLARGR